MTRRRVDADPLRPHAAAARPAPARRALGRPRRARFVVDRARSRRPRRPPRIVLAPLPRGLRPREPARRRLLGGRRAARLRRALRAPRRRSPPRRGRHRAARPPRRAAAARPRRALPVRLLAHWDQPLLAYADRERIIPAELSPLQLTLSGDPTVTVDGRVAASWALERERRVARITVDAARRAPPRRARARSAPRRSARARICEPDARRVEVTGV